MIISFFIIGFAFAGADVNYIYRISDRDMLFRSVLFQDNEIEADRIRRSIVDDDPRLLGFRFVQEPQDAIAIKDETASFHCQPSFDILDLDVRTEWRKDGSDIDIASSGGRLRIDVDGSLSISKLTNSRSGQSDVGLYQCVITVVYRDSTWSFVSRKANLRLAVLSRFEQQPADQTVVKGDSVLLPCRLTAFPPATILWYRNGRLLDPEEDSKLTLIPIAGSLQMDDVDERHSGVYKCQAVNVDKSRFSDEGHLDVRQREAPSEPIGPRFVVEPTGQALPESESILLECLVVGTPRPVVRWLKGNKTVRMDDERVRIVGRSSLLIRKLIADDTGVYTCRAANSEDSVDASAVVRVEVAPTFVVQPEHTIGKETTDIEFDCRAVGSPAPSVTWYKNGEVIIASEYFMIEATKLRVLGLVITDQGVYQCLAENEIGSIQSSAQLLVDVAEYLYPYYSMYTDYDGRSMANDSSNDRSDTMTPVPDARKTDLQPTWRVPSEPLGVRLVGSASRFVSLAWDPPLRRQGGILAYVVYFKEHTSTRERMRNSTSLTLTVDRLQPNSIYQFRVVAINGHGAGQSSSVIKVVTDREQAVPGTIRNLVARALSPTSVEILWDPPTRIGATPKNYRLFYDKADGGDGETEITTTDTTYTVHGLSKFVRYSFRVEAEGVNGPGLSSDRVIVSTQSDRPSASPRNVRVSPSSTTSLLVQWDPPPNDHLNGVITGYRVRYKPRMRGSKGHTLVVDGDAGRHIISDLDPNGQYVIRVAAVTGNGTGPHSDWVRAETFEMNKEEMQIPGPPTSLRVQARSDSIRLSWTAPFDDDIKIRGFIVGWGINIPDVHQTKVGPVRRYFLIEGLFAGHIYVVSLRAYNRLGNGFPIYETVRTTLTDDSIPPHLPIGSLKTPTGVRAISESASSIRVIWTDRDETLARFGDTRRHYTIGYGVSSADGIVQNAPQRYVNATSTDHVINDLRPNTEYEFVIRVVLGHSVSSWSMAAVNRTLAAAPSSAPRDLTAVQPGSGDPLSVMLNWQPPKYSNGEIQEYIIFYTDEPDLPDSRWTLDGVRGDRLSTVISNLLPKTTYYLKIQARNGKGYGPFSTVLQYVAGLESGHIFPSDDRIFDSSSELSPAVLFSGLALIGLLSCIVLVLIGLICCRRQGRTNRRRGYLAGKKMNKNDVKPPPDLWIDHPHGHELQNRDPSGNSLDVSVHVPNRDLHPRTSPPPPRYHSLGDGLSAIGGGSEIRGQRRVGRAKPIVIRGRSGPSSGYLSDADSSGTLTYSYHQSSGSLEGSNRQRMPQVVYTGRRGNNKNNNNASSDLTSEDQSRGPSAVYDCTPPCLPDADPPPPPLPPSSNDISCPTLSHRNASNALRSFAAVASPPPPPPAPCSESLRALIVPSPRVKQQQHLPIGRTAPSPRQPPISTPIYSSYACSPTIKEKTDSEQLPELEMAYSQSLSTEELNAQMQNLDTMIDDLQAMHQQFNGVQ